MADDALQLIDALGFDKVHWCGHSTGGAMGQVLAIEHPERLSRLVLSATWARTDTFFPPPVRGACPDAEELGPAAYQKSSALALNAPAWVRDHDAELAAAEARRTRPSRCRRSCCRASPRSSRTTSATAADGARADAGDLRPRRHGDAALLHRGAGPLIPNARA
jgi:pimeloyl-ACP methyl ester carboxylesterase